MNRHGSSGSGGGRRRGGANLGGDDGDDGPVDDRTSAAETNAPNRRAYVTASSFATNTSSAKAAKRQDAMALLQTMSKARHAQGVVAAASALSSPPGAPSALASVLQAASESRPVTSAASASSAVFAPMTTSNAAASSSGGPLLFGQWRDAAPQRSSSTTTAEDGARVADHALVLSHGEFRFRGQTMFIDKKQIPRSPDAAASLERMGATRDATNVEALSLVHGAIAAIRRRRMAVEGVRPVVGTMAAAVVPQGAVRLAEEAVRRCLSARGWHAALAATFSLANGRSVLTRGGPSGRVWQPPDACVGSLEEKGGHELLHRLLFAKGHLQRQLRIHAALHNASGGACDDWLDARRLKHSLNVAGDWQSALSCVKAVRPWVCRGRRLGGEDGGDTSHAAEVAPSSHDAYVYASAALAAMHSPPLPVSTPLFALTCRKPFAPAKFVPVSTAPASIPWRQALWVLRRPIAAQQQQQQQHQEQRGTVGVVEQPLWEWLCTAAEPSKSSAPSTAFTPSASALKNAAAIVDILTQGGAPLEQIQGVVDALCGPLPTPPQPPRHKAAAAAAPPVKKACASLEFNMRNTHLWAAYARACALRPPPDVAAGSTASDSGGWAAALTLLSANAAEHRVTPTPSMYEAGMFAALSSHFTTTPSTSTATPSTAAPAQGLLLAPGPGWHWALRLVGRCQTQGLPLSQSMLGMALTARIVGARLNATRRLGAEGTAAGGEAEEEAFAAARTAVISARDVVDRFALPELAISSNGNRGPASQQQHQRWRGLLVNAPGRAPPHTELVMAIAIADAIASEEVAANEASKSLLASLPIDAAAPQRTPTAASALTADDLFDA